MKIEISSEIRLKIEEFLKFVENCTPDTELISIDLDVEPYLIEKLLLVNGWDFIELEDCNYNFIENREASLRYEKPNPDFDDKNEEE
jgi:hypothetical protein